MIEQFIKLYYQDQDCSQDKTSVKSVQSETRTVNPDVISELKIALPSIPVKELRSLVRFACDHESE